MKIVGIGSFMNTAGAQSALVKLMENLRLRGHDTQTWFFYEEQPAFRGRPNVYSFSQKPRLSLLEYAVLPLRTLAKLRAEKPDVVVTFLPLACVVGQIAARVCGVPRRIASQRTPPGTHSGMMIKLDRFLGTGGFYTANICVSQAVFEDFSSYPTPYREKLAVVHNGIEWRGSALTREAARAVLGLQPGEIAMAATGRMKTQKNYPLMLKALAAAPGLRLFIAGDGPLRDQLEAQARVLGIADRVRFLGALDSGGIADLLRAADIFIQTSTFEGQSNSLLEAMAEGLPIVASDIPMQRETVVSASGDACARLLPLDDAAPWGEALRALAVDTAERQALGAAAKDFVAAQFTLKAMIDGFERILLAEPGARVSG